ncbi:MAG: hypothetical protein VYC39_02655 [Myxococcota bacterium]|nr:hypothetical protein [Myxococcota bacterium]
MRVAVGSSLCIQLVLLTGFFDMNSAEVWAHKPSYADGGNGELKTAHAIDNIDISMVLYKENTCESSQTWLTFTSTQPGQQLFVQLGVPQLERLRERRPTIAVMAPGLPSVSQASTPLPFALPEGFGVEVFDTSEVSEGRPFFEFFTGTKSWIMHESHLTLPQAGQGYVVAWFPDNTSGKLWVAIGETEDFSEDDFALASYWIEKTQTFHEEGVIVEPEDIACLEKDTSSGGCQNVSGIENWPLLFAIYFLLLRRRRII